MAGTMGGVNLVFNFQVGSAHKTCNPNGAAIESLTSRVRMMPRTKSAKNTFLNLKDDCNQKAYIAKISKDASITPDQFSTSLLIDKCLNSCGEVKASVVVTSFLGYNIKCSPKEVNTTVRYMYWNILCLPSYPHNHLGIDKGCVYFQYPNPISLKKISLSLYYFTI